MRCPRCQLAKRNPLQHGPATFGDTDLSQSNREIVGTPARMVANIQHGMPV